MTNDQFDDLIRDAATSYNPPPEAPLDEMWREIERQPRAVARRSILRRLLPLAAVFVGGISLGRVWGTHTTSGPTAGAVVAVASPAPTPDLPEEVTTNRYLGQTAALLYALPVELHGPRADSSYIAEANDLLLTTRMLLDSPSSSADPALRGLFEDLESVLAQVARLPRHPSPVDVDLLTQALQQRDVLPRLRTAVVSRAAN